MIRSTTTLALLAAVATSGPAQENAAAAPIHSVTDISHTFSFYFDGRFARNYVEPLGGRDARNWGTLHKCDLGNTNLLVLQSEGSPCPYPAQDVAAVRRFLESGGGVVVLGDWSTFRGEKSYRLNELAGAFGAEFVDVKATRPLAPAAGLDADKIESHGGGKVLKLENPAAWSVLIRDGKRRVVMAERPVGEGRLLVVSRALAGRRPDASDPINSALWQARLSRLAGGKRVDPGRRPRGTMPERLTEKGGLKIQCSEYLAPMADVIFRVFKKGRPQLERILGVPPHPGMLTKLILLPTGGGGFSSGRAIGLGVWWGGFPKKRYGMVELLGHEATHSWVLPFAEPMWNEGLATYVGILLGRKLGHAKEANATLQRWLASARRHDPEMTRYDLARGKDVPHAVRMAKPMWIWEQLRKERPDVLQRYFREKRRRADPAAMRGYTADDCVAVLSLAMERDLFPWFRSLGIDVERERTTIGAGR